MFAENVIVLIITFFIDINTASQDNIIYTAHVKQLKLIKVLHKGKQHNKNSNI